MPIEFSTGTSTSGGSITFSNSNRTVTKASLDNIWAFAQVEEPKYTGLHYFEFLFTGTSTSSFSIGFTRKSISGPTQEYPGQRANDFGFIVKASQSAGVFTCNAYVNNVSIGTYSQPATTTSIVGMAAVNYTTRKIWIGINGTWFNSGDPAAGTGEITTFTRTPMGLYCPAIGINNVGATATVRIPAEFSYSAPSGFSNGWLDYSNTSGMSFYSLTGGATPDYTSTILLSCQNTVAITRNGTRRVNSLFDLTSNRTRKLYFEVLFDSTASVSAGQAICGVSLPQSVSSAYTTDAGTLVFNEGTITSGSTTIGTFAGAGPTETNPCVIQFAIDLPANKLWVGRNGTWWNSGNPVTGTNPTISDVGIGLFFSSYLATVGCYTALIDPSLNFYTPPTGYSTDFTTNSLTHTQFPPLRHISWIQFNGPIERSGTVTVNGSPASKPIYLIHFGTQQILSKVVSDPTTGAFSFGN